VARGELDSLLGHEVHERIVHRGRGRVDGRHHGFVSLRPRDGQEVRKALMDRLGLRPHAAGHDHPAVLGHGLADGLQGLGLGAVQEAAGVDDHHVGPVVTLGQLIPLGAQLRDDALGIDQRLGAAEGHEGDFWGRGVHGGSKQGGPGPGGRGFFVTGAVRG
jgi:hypothetical protein